MAWTLVVSINAAGACRGCEDAIGWLDGGSMHPSPCKEKDKESSGARCETLRAMVKQRKSPELPMGAFRRMGARYSAGCEPR
jgi:hypothetical protein